MLRTTSLATGLVLATFGLASAQDVVTTTTTTGPAGVHQVRRVSQLLRSTVHLQGANNYGKVEDVVLNENGAPAYMVVSNGGKYAMFPWNAADINYGQRVVNYGVTPQSVQPLFFQPNAWPNVAEPQFTNRMTQVFPADNVKVKVKPNGTVKEKIR